MAVNATSTSGARWPPRDGGDEVGRTAPPPLAPCASGRDEPTASESAPVAPPCGAQDARPVSHSTILPRVFGVDGPPPPDGERAEAGSARAGTEVPTSLRLMRALDSKKLLRLLGTAPAPPSVQSPSFDACDDRHPLLRASALSSSSDGFMCASTRACRPPHGNSRGAHPGGGVELIRRRDVSVARLTIGIESHRLRRSRLPSRSHAPRVPVVACARVSSAASELRRQRSPLSSPPRPPNGPLLLSVPAARPKLRKAEHDRRRRAGSASSGDWRAGKPSPSGPQPGSGCGTVSVRTPSATAAGEAAAVAVADAGSSSDSRRLGDVGDEEWLGPWLPREGRWLRLGAERRNWDRGVAPSLPAIGVPASHMGLASQHRDELAGGEQAFSRALWGLMRIRDRL